MSRRNAFAALEESDDDEAGPGGAITDSVSGAPAASPPHRAAAPRAAAPRTAAPRAAAPRAAAPSAAYSSSSSAQIVDHAEDAPPMSAAAWRELGHRAGVPQPPPPPASRAPAAAAPTAPARPAREAPAASSSGEYSAGIAAGEDALRRSFQRGLSYELQLEAATQAKAAFAEVWLTAKTRQDSFGQLMTARIAALTGEAMVRMALLCTLLEDYSPDVAATYDSAITLLTSARTDADELLALQVAGALHANSLVNPDDLSSEVAQAVELSVSQAEALKRGLARVIERMGAEHARMVEARDAVRAKMGDKWGGGGGGGGGGGDGGRMPGQLSAPAMAMRALGAKLRGAQELQAAIIAVDHRLQALVGPTARGGGSDY